MTLSDRQQQVKDRFIEVHGMWSPTWESVLRLDLEFLRA